MTTTTPELCRYCWEEPIKEGWRDSCADCVFICTACKQVTPYELGADPGSECNPCWAINN